MHHRLTNKQTTSMWRHCVDASCERLRDGTYTDVREKPEVFESRCEHLKLSCTAADVSADAARRVQLHERGGG